MSHANPPHSKWPSTWFLTSLILAALAALSLPALAQEAAVHVGAVQIIGLPNDWTHHHVVFSDPGSSDDAIKNGTYNKWFSVVNDPRYVMQQLKRGLPVRGPAAVDAGYRAVLASKAASALRDDLSLSPPRLIKDPESPIDRVEPMVKREKTPPIKQDWSMLLTNAGTKPGVGAGMYPAKFSFDPTPSSPANCASAASPDYVVYNTGVPGVTGSSTAAGQATVVAFYNLYSACSSDTSGPKIVPAVYWAFNTGGTVSTSVVLSSDGTQMAFIQTPSSGNTNPQLVVLKPGTTLQTGRTLTGTIATSGTEVTLTGTSQTFTAADVGAQISTSTGNIPASDTIATILSTTTATLTTAPTSAKTGATITITADALSPFPLSSSTCTAAPCMTAVSFNGTASSRTDTISSPFYDYSGDNLYVGDAQGYLHKFHPVFDAAPLEVTSGGWPAQVSTKSSPALTSPIYDSGNQDVFVGDESGYLYAVSTSGGVTASDQLGTVNGSTPAMVDAPLLDITNDELFAFVSDDTSASASSFCDVLGCSAVVEVGTTTGTSTGDFSGKFAESVISPVNTNPIYAGAFDNLYWTSSGGTGNLYVEGSNASGEPKLIAVPLSAEVIQAETASGCPTGHTAPPNSSNTQCANNIENPITSAAAAPSPVTEFCNNSTSACVSGSTDYIYASVTTAANLTASGANKCSGATQACLYSWNTASALTGTTAPSDGLATTGGTSGIIIDNSATSSGASQVYYSTLSSGTCTTSGTNGSVTSGSCAVQAAQGTL